MRITLRITQFFKQKLFFLFFSVVLKLEVLLCIVLFILSLLRCYDVRAHVDEELYPASNETNPVLKNKKVCKVR